MRVLVSMFLLACQSSPSPETGSDIDTGWFTDTASPENCTGVVTDVTPKAGTQQWYFRDMPKVWTGNDRTETYAASLWQGATQLPSQLVWDEGGVSFSVVGEGPFSSDTDYELSVTDCRETQRIPFRTSRYGAPLDGAPSDLVGTTYLINLAGATWIEPGGFSAILSLYFTTPILLMVSYADADFVDFLGAQGYRDDLGLYHQNPSEPTFEFPLARWPESPYFEVLAPQVNISVQGISVSIYDFSLEGTFAADGSAIGGAKLQGLGDTRYMGALIGKADEPGALCEQALALGVPCSDCPDGQPYCMFLSAVDVDGARVPGLQLSPRD
jgi:hypothetical protein